MVHRTYVSLGAPDAAASEFKKLEPWALDLLGLRAECPMMGADYMAFGIALDGLQTAAYHFTRRPDFYAYLETPRPNLGANGRLSDRIEALAAFEALTPYSGALRKLMTLCRPFGRDYLALMIAHQSLETAAFHFTRDAHFYGLKDGAAGRPHRTS